MLKSRLSVLASIIAVSLSVSVNAANPAVRDIFDRDIAQQGITLIDWEGYMANPAIEISIVPPSDGAFPIKATVTAREPRLYFDLPSTGSAQGPSKQMTFDGAQPQPMAVAAFPAREKKKFESALNIQMSDARSRRWQVTVPLHITFTDRSSGSTGSRPTTGMARNAVKPEVYPITVDFSQDKTGFFKEETRRKLFDQAVQDWAFYLAPIPLTPVPAGAEKTWIFEPTGFTKSNLITNANPYTGYLLYGYGVDGPEVRSGGEPSQAGAFQQSGGQRLPIRRSGGLELEIKGNYNKLGWNFTLRDEEWWKATNLAAMQNDYYSVVHHECGHALFFNPNNTKFKRSAVLSDEAVRAYLEKDAATDARDHFDGILDPASLRGAFGNEYHGNVPLGRWLITKLDLLCAQAIGYKLRPVDALVPLEVETESLPAASPRKGYKASLHAQGGIPFYDWSVVEGKLPAGLSLNRFTGEISGTPMQAGSAAFKIKVRDYTKNGEGATRSYTMTVSGP